MTDFEKVKGYYDRYDEWSRLDAPEGRLEFEILMKIVRSEIESGATILDLGGGPGRYTAALSLAGYQMHLADLSPELIAAAKVNCAKYGDVASVKSINVVNALDLQMYSDASFDAVILFGPLYHLTREDEIMRCLSEVHRVLKPSGTVIAVYIPWLSGVRSVLARAVYQAGQADISTVAEVYHAGTFRNQGDEGFQEGRYLRAEELTGYMHDAGFEQRLLRSVRGLGNGMEAAILKLKDQAPATYHEILELIHTTAADASILSSSGHAVYVGRKAS